MVCGRAVPRPWAPCFTNNAPDSDRDQPDQFDKYPLTRKRGILFSPPSLFSSLVLLKLLQCVNCPWYALALVCGKVSCRYGLLVYNEPHIFNPVTDEHGILVSTRTLIFHLICIYLYLHFACANRPELPMSCRLTADTQRQEHSMTEARGVCGKTKVAETVRAESFRNESRFRTSNRFQRRCIDSKIK